MYFPGTIGNFDDSYISCSLMNAKESLTIYSQSLQVAYDQLYI